MTLINAIAFGCGILFAIGLGISGMTLPQKVLGFLDVTRNWDPSLLFVMGGAVVTHHVFYRLIRKRVSPLFSSHFHYPSGKEIDRKLLGGAAVFGIGWGLAGFCPGPALTNLATGNLGVIAFVLLMMAGIWVGQRIK